MTKIETLIFIRTKETSTIEKLNQMLYSGSEIIIVMYMQYKTYTFVGKRNINRFSGYARNRVSRH